MIGWMILMLLGQIACAVVGLVVLGRRVAPALQTLRTDEPGLIADVWAPLALVFPMLFLVGRVDRSVHGVGWVPVAAAVGVAVVGVGWAMSWRRDPAGAGAGGHPDAPSAAPRLGPALGLAGLILLLLGAAHELTIWTGQCTFAIVAVLLWMNTPHHVPRSAAGPRSEPERFGRWLALAVLLAIGQGVCAVLVPAAAAHASAVLTVAYALAGVMVASAVAGVGWGRRIAGWTATFGTLLAIGTLSLLHLAPQSLGVARGLRDHVDAQVAYGFGEYAIEATLLFVLALAVGVPIPAVPPRLLGVFLLLVGAVLVAWRSVGLLA